MNFAIMQAELNFFNGPQMTPLKRGGSYFGIKCFSIFHKMSNNSIGFYMVGTDLDILYLPPC